MAEQSKRHVPVLRVGQRQRAGEQLERSLSKLLDGQLLGGVVTTHQGEREQKKQDEAESHGRPVSNGTAQTRHSFPGRHQNRERPTRSTMTVAVARSEGMCCKEPCRNQ